METTTQSSTKLSDHDVALIAELIEEGMSLREIAAKFEAMAKS